MESEKLSKAAREIISDSDSIKWISVVSLWEVAIKRSQSKQDFRFEVGPLRAGYLANGYEELSIEARHVLNLRAMPMLHADPFDRLLIAQAGTEGMVLLTADRKLAKYGDMVHVV